MRMLTDEEREARATKGKELRDLLAKATPGPWRNDGYVAGEFSVTAMGPLVARVTGVRSDYEVDAVGDYGPDSNEPNAALIVAMRNHLETMLDVIEAADLLAFLADPAEIDSDLKVAAAAAACHMYRAARARLEGGK